MRPARSLIDSAVYNMQDGRLLGKAQDLYLDKDLTAVTAVYLGGEGLIKRTPTFIRRRDIALFGLDAILAHENTIVYRGEEIPTAGAWVRLHNLQGREVDTPGGTKIGRIRDVVLDADARITGFILGQIAVEGPIAEHKAVARNSLVDVGQEDGAMTLDLAIAEREGLTLDPDSLSFDAPIVGPRAESPPCAGE